MRNRDRILQNLETLFREAYAEAEGRGDGVEMARLDLEFQRDQLYLEAILDIRDLLVVEEDTEGETSGTSLLEQAQAMRKLVRGR
jgi:hypothetical protein